MARTRLLTELRSEDAAEFGGKSANLGELLAAGIPVPAGFAIARERLPRVRRGDRSRGTIASALAVSQ